MAEDGLSCPPSYGSADHGSNVDIEYNDRSENENRPLTSMSAVNKGSNTSLTSLVSADDSSHSFMTEPNDDDFWPHNFQRTMSLLAGPSNVRRVEWCTKSPRFGHLETIRKEKLELGLYTPDPNIHSCIREKEENRYLDDDIKLNRMQSLDFPRKPGQVPGYQTFKPLSPGTVAAVENKRLAAHEYRKQMLEFTAAAGEEKKDLSKRKKKRKKKSYSAKDEQKSSFLQCTFNMCNILMGVGMLGLPFVLKSAGWIGGFSVATTFALITWRTSYLLGRLLNGDHRSVSLFSGSKTDPSKTGKPVGSFPEIARHTFGYSGAVFLSLVLYFELFSCLAIFFVSIGEHMVQLLPQYSVSTHETIFAILLAFPTILLKTPRLLSYLSAVGTASTVAVVAVVVASALANGDVTDKFMDPSNSDENGERTFYRSVGLPVAMGIIAYTFSGHAIVPSIYSSMRNPHEFERMIDLTFVIVFTACSLVAGSGYYMFGSLVEDQVTISLAEYSKGGGPINILTALMVLTSFSKFTLTTFPLALGIEEIFVPYISKGMNMGTISAFTRLTLIFLALLVAVYVPSFSFLCSLVGLVCTMTVSVIFPSAAHLLAFGSNLTATEKILDYSFIIFGFFSAIVGTLAMI
mmetsp:Transcript_26821/g.61743  ORF Transcript_26821/g.61743 Transcript_26821/m.61743 type:complete len:632 (-) Transcript_26821:83-1978(-)|eukprot:CAMPEP_0113315576 /NCGR_PEP_ID=MMETSP0010_2-20120614/11192_1 /TAXON_ID=216773 ORGANISM="Corethron hystrix, Strain 308" /NCGR_SAMPLE_ID=MMETSP0010_2 /ASSEMBLY_ACC=CAM_ASM_000155 /LENGTH=631 /DNA_ID=CAMNT_0000172111 /DNA_START=50 /DNA_END=1945 /DNA_ORIENTATION=+ /assembly_acc=CAM_ASM_000155